MALISLVCESFEATVNEDGAIELRLDGVEPEHLALEASEVCSTDSIIHFFTKEEFLDEIGEEAALYHFERAEQNQIQDLQDRKFINIDLIRELEEDNKDLESRINEKWKTFATLRSFELNISNLDSLQKQNELLKKRAVVIAKENYNLMSAQGFFQRLWKNIKEKL